MSPASRSEPDRAVARGCAGSAPSTASTAPSAVGRWRWRCERRSPATISHAYARHWRANFRRPRSADTRTPNRAAEARAALATKKIRVYELARELGVENQVVLAVCERSKTGVTS